MVLFVFLNISNNRLLSCYRAGVRSLVLGFVERDIILIRAGGGHGRYVKPLRQDHIDLQFPLAYDSRRDGAKCRDTNGLNVFNWGQISVPEHLVPCSNIHPHVASCPVALRRRSHCATASIASDLSYRPTPAKIRRCDVLDRAPRIEVSDWTLLYWLRWATSISPPRHCMVVKTARICPLIMAGARIASGRKMPGTGDSSKRGDKTSNRTN